MPGVALGFDYALGLSVAELAGVPQISHGGATSGYRTFLTRFPDRGVSIAVLANVGNFDAAATARDVTRLVLELPAPRAAARSSMPARRVGSAVTSPRESPAWAA